MAALDSSSLAPPPSDQQQLQHRQTSAKPNPNPPATNRSVAGGGGVTMMNNSPQQPQSTTTRPVIPQPQRPHPPQYHPHPVFGVPAPPPRLSSLSLHPSPPPPPPPPLQQQQQQGILYPVASSGRGFIPKPTLRPTLSPDQAAVAGFPPRPVYHHIGPPSASVPDSNGIKHPRNRSKDDTLSTIRDRKVKISDGMSLYALCRSWLRNGVPEETQPQYPDIMQPLPRPFPMAALEAVSPNKRDNDEENEEDEGSVEHVSAQELLYRHVKRAKRVRARLRDERLQRIGRYKARLALLLPPVVEQFRNDTVAGN
ncbi:Protein LIN37 [Dillenia turbinata]|uniref:Protein LIN37 n=1 Tax=Dillenia turbinata TaxID=194707 RepID=A0AAN8ZD25_9MAGN